MQLMVYLLKSAFRCLLLFIVYIIAYLCLGPAEHFFHFAGLCFLAMVAAFITGIKQFHKKKRIKKIDKMAGDEFERYLCSYFRSRGYNASVTKKSGDFGADLILDRFGRRTVVQVKRYKNKVGISAVQEAIGAIAYYNADKGIVVTNSYFTKSAKALAEANNIDLLDRDYIIKHAAK